MNIIEELDNLIEENGGELSLTDCAYHFYNATKQEMIEKAVEWLEPVLKNYAGYNCGGDLVKNFEKYMEK